MIEISEITDCWSEQENVWNVNLYPFHTGQKSHNHLLTYSDASICSYDHITLRIAQQVSFAGNVYKFKILLEG